MVGEFGGTTQPVSLPPRPSPSEERYELARSVFTERIADLTTEQAKNLSLFVARDCSLIYLATDSFDDAFRLFTIVNDRGKQLRRIDVLKAINLAPEVVTSETSRSMYAQKWEEMESRLGESQFEEIFHLLRLIYTKDKPQADLHTEFTNRIYGKRGRPTPGKSFLDELERFVNLYDALFIDKDYLDADDGKCAKFRTLMSAMATYFTASEWKACLLSYARKFGRKGLYEFMLRIEKVYLELWVTGTRKDERYGRYTAILTGIEAAINFQDAVSSASADLESIRDACRADNFYSAGPSKYLLVRAEILAGELDHARQFLARSVEHVLPQNPADGSEWVSKFDADTLKGVVNKAGNLVLLSKAKNSSAGRRDFAEKKSGYLKPRVSDFPRSVAVLDYSTWTKEIIEERTEEFARTVLQDP